MTPNAEQSATQTDPTIAGYAASDGPSPIDSLGFKPYVEAIATFLTHPNTKPPITISVEGEWGSGKSSFLLQLEAAILQICPKDVPRPRTIRFNAWRHDKQDQLWAAFALAFIETLRKKIGLPRALYGDLKLFLKRLQGVRAWTELILLVTCLPIAVALGIRYIILLSQQDLLHLLARLAKPSPNEPSLNLPILNALSKHGLGGAILSVAVAGLWKFHNSFKLPLSLDLKKYLADPGYEGHTAFVETFHKDLKRLIESYAGNSRVFVFVDDLDRCDVPRAAELMQAINLMIGDTGNLVFILGMDREKVAAGVALKYKDLLPFMRESALWKPGTDKNDFSPLYFGYAYLEKFIQLSFTLPTPNTEDALNRFLTPPVAQPIPTGWINRLLASRQLYWERIERNFNLNTGEESTRPIWKLFYRPKAAANQTKKNAQSTQSGTSQPEGAVPASPTEYHRVAIKEDDDRTRAVIRMTAPLFEYNPRRIKQFTNTFRLALYLASDLGLFDVDDSTSFDDTRPTPEQLGKFIALLLHFPDLRFALEQDPKLLATLEREALAIKFPSSPTEIKFPPSQTTEQPNSLHSRWFEHPGAIDLLAFNVSQWSEMCPNSPRPNGESNENPRYSLKNFNIASLFTILPKAPPPTKPSGPTLAVYEQLTALALQYEQIRSEQRFSTTRTRRMSELFKQAQAAAREGFTQQNAPSGNLFVESPRGTGSRLIFLAVASVFIDLRNAELLLSLLQKPRSPFEHYHAIETWLLYIDPLADLAPQVLKALSDNWDEIEKDQPRLRLAIRLRKAAAQETPELTYNDYET